MSIAYVSALMAAKCLVAGALIAAGVVKLRQPDAAVAFLRDVGVPALGRKYVIRLVAVGELILGIALVVAGGRAVYAVTVVLFAVFTIVIGTGFARDVQPECGCFGNGSGRVNASHVLRNVVLTLGATSLFMTYGNGAMLAANDFAVRGGSVLLMITVLVAYYLVGRTAALFAQ